MNGHTKELLEQIECEYQSHHIGLNLCILHGEKGLGKRIAVREFLKYHSNNAHILIDINQNTIPVLNIDFDKNGVVFKNDSVDQLLNSMISFIEVNNSIMVLYNFHQYTNETYYFLSRLLFHLESKNIYLFVIIVANNDYPDSLKKINEFCANFSTFSNYLTVKGWTDKNLSELFKSMYKNMEITQKQLNMIIAKSHSNMLSFLCHIEYLKSLNIIRREGIKTVCDSFDEGLLLYDINDYVAARFKRLEPLLQEALIKASLIGPLINLNLLQEQMKVMNARNIFIRIEQISRLIQNRGIELFEFENEDVMIQIASYMDQGEYETWNLALATYFHTSAAKQVDNVSTKALCDLIGRAAFHYVRCGRKDEAVYLYMQLIPRMIALQLFQSALSVIGQVKKLIEYHSTDNDINKLLYYYGIICYKNCFDYKAAILLLKKYERISAPNIINGIDMQFLKAQLLYNSGYIQEAYNILYKLYYNIKSGKIKKIDKETKINIISMLSSVEDTLNDRKSIPHFNEALALANEYKLHEVYYRLLRMANLAHSEKMGIELMKKAEKYFISVNDLKELAYVRHNIGTESLFCDEYPQAYAYIDKAYKDLDQLCNGGYICSRNSMAIYFALYQADYEKAYELLSLPMTVYNEPFCQLVIMNNKLTCLRKLNRLQEAYYVMEEIIELNSQESNSFSYFENFMYLQKAFMFKTDCNYKEALNCFLNFFESGYDLYNAVWIMAVLNIINLCQLLGVPVPAKVIPYINAKNKVAELLYKNDLVFCTLFFWEH